MKSNAREEVSPSSCWAEIVARQSFASGPWALVCAVCLLWISAQVPAAERQKLHGSVPAMMGHLRALERLAGTNRLNLVMVLPLRNQEALASLLGQLYAPTSPAYHRYLTPEQFAERFGPTRQDYATVMAFAEANGLLVTRTHPNRTLVDVNGAAADVEKTFHVRLHLYEHPTEGRKFYAPDVEPSLDLAVPLLLVSGLGSFGAPRPASWGSFSFRKDSDLASAAATFGSRVGSQRVSDRERFPGCLRPGGLAGWRRASGGVAGVRWLLHR